MSVSSKTGLSQRAAQEAIALACAQRGLPALVELVLDPRQDSFAH